MTNAKQIFPALTGVRFIAASLVFIFHYAHEIVPGRDGFIFYLLRQLNIGVNLFFVLSGFLITHRYFDLVFSGSNLQDYIIKRIARIFPLYYVVLVTQMVLFYLHNHTWPDATTLLLNITLLKGFSSFYLYSILTQTWSLTVEEMFYFYAPISFFLIKTKNFFWGQIPMLFGIGFSLVFLSSLLPTDTVFGGVKFLFEGTFFGRCFEFFIGIFLAIYIRKKGRKPGRTFVTFSGFVLFLFLLFSLAGYAYLHKIRSINEFAVGIMLFNILIPVSFGLILYGLIIENTLAKRFLSLDFLVLLGKSSYAFYLLHIGMIAEIIFFKISTNLLLLYALLQILSIAAYKSFEKPFYFFTLRHFRISGRRKEWLP
jgi:peptidoglycan/LPS O-acetylase OafA/YrhL